MLAALSGALRLTRIGIPLKSRLCEGGRQLHGGVRRRHSNSTTSCLVGNSDGDTKGFLVKEDSIGLVGVKARLRL